MILSKQTNSYCQWLVCIAFLVLPLSANAIFGKGTSSNLLKSGATLSTETFGNCPLHKLNPIRQLATFQPVVAEAKLAVTPQLDQSTENLYKSYGQLCAIQHLEGVADAMAKSNDKAMLCYRGLKKALNAGAPWMLELGRPPGNHAYEAKDDLEAQGFVDVLALHPELAEHPELAPEGAIIVYKRNKVPCNPNLTTSAVCRAIKSGDVQLKTQTGYVNSAWYDNPMTAQTQGYLVEVSGVMLKRVILGPKEPGQKCVLSALPSQI